MPRDGIQVAAGWFIINLVWHLVDKVEDQEHYLDSIAPTLERMVNLAFGLSPLAFRFVNFIQSPGGSSRVSDIFTEGWSKVAQGQALGFEQKLDRPVNDVLELYWRETIIKSGSVLWMATAGGAAAGTGDKLLIDALGEYGTALGVILQILDDCRDVLRRDGAGSMEYEITLPLLLYLMSEREERVRLPDSSTSQEFVDVLFSADIPQMISAVLLEWERRALQSLTPLGESNMVAGLTKIVRDILEQESGLEGL